MARSPGRRNSASEIRVIPSPDAQYMLDTDTVSFALRGQGRVGTRLLEHRPSELCISSIALAKLRFGAEARRSRRLHRLISKFVAAEFYGCTLTSLLPLPTARQRQR